MRSEGCWMCPSFFVWYYPDHKAHEMCGGEDPECPHRVEALEVCPLGKVSLPPLCRGQRQAMLFEF